jgi:hypothetical protein
MCPQAEKLLGQLAAADPAIVPIAFHVDYFNDPWKDIFSEARYSQRQMTYNQIYTKPKPAEYGLYYTPMLMVDGEQSVNGRDAASAKAAVREALAKEPAVRLELEVRLKPDKLSGTATLRVTSRADRAENTPLLVCAVLRENGVVTKVRSGENAGKALVASFPARRTKFKFIELRSKTPVTQTFDFEVDRAWKQPNLRLAAFVQDKATGEIHQAADVPWLASEHAKTTGSESSGVREKKGRGAKSAQ